jgi:hypothetical protein
MRGFLEALHVRCDSAVFPASLGFIVVGVGLPLSLWLARHLDPNYKNTAIYKDTRQGREGAF